MSFIVIQIDVRFAMNQNGWHVSDVRTGSRPWLNLDAVVAAVGQEKEKRARSELAAIATALEGFRKEHGVYVVSEMQPVLIDYLSPRYLSRVIRIDPWHRPYKYSGERDHFSLRSVGADGTENTADDIVVTRSVQTTRKTFVTCDALQFLIVATFTTPACIVRGNHVSL